MTEEEAKTKWCPFVRTAYGTGAKTDTAPTLTLAAVNQDLGGNPLGHCIASSCMAWRWVPRWEGEEPTLSSEGTGFCGLAGNHQS